jgi:DNA-binding SARP family transcriptional activator
MRIGSPTQRTLLALLLMHPNEVVSTDRIVDVLWRENPLEARRKLWFHVSKLRGTLQPGRAEDAAGGILVTRPTGYMLRIDADQLDAARFERLTRSARSLLEADPARAAETLRRALAVWRGEPFEDILHEDAVSSEVERWNELRVAALEDRLEADLALGRDGELIPELEALVAEHPYREHLRAQLMLALYRAGRQAEALGAYRQARRTLVQELGIEPSEEVKELQRRILAHDPILGGARTPPRRRAAREERKVVTVFFAELVDFTAKAERLDPEDVRAFLSPYYARIRSDLERFGGTVEKFIGDTLMALFGAPAAHEDDPERAVRAALAIRDWLIEQGDALHARIGVATGEALVTLGGTASERDPIAVGEVVKTAASLRVAAPVNGVIVDEQTFRRTRDAIEYRGVEAIAAKGTSEPISVWEAIRPRGGARTYPALSRSPFLGRERERELATLQERLAWAGSQRSPQLVTILGVPGIGKTRLVAEMQQAAAGAGEPVSWLYGRSLPYGDGVSFWAFGEMVKAEAGILESDPPDRAEHKLRNAVERIVDDSAEARTIATSLGALIGLGSAEAATGGRRSETFAAWRQFVEALADERPLVLVFEDLQWADEGLLDFVDELVDRASGVTLLVVATARPELLERRPRWAGGKPSALTITLPPLSQSDSARLVAALLEQPALQAEVQEALLARVSGNPLYAEQFCRILVEHGRLEELPETVHGIIAARLDLLADDEKRLLQDAAVVGKVFWVGALEAIGGVSRQHAEELLHALARRGFVQGARRSSVEGDIEYTFGHELLRDVAYGEIPRAGRAAHHRRAAQWIDSLGRPEDHAELLAHHYLAALDYGRSAGEDITAVVQRTVQALHRAGLRAMRLSANERAVEHFSRAIAVVERLPEGDERSRTEAQLQLQLGIALFALQGFSAPGVERAYGRATELMMASAPTAEQFPIHFGLSIFHGHRGNFDRSTRLAERMSKLASQGDESMRLQALHARWMNSLFGGRIDDAVAAADEGRAIYRPEAHHATSFLYGNHDPGVCALSLQALGFAFRGESVRAVTQMREAVALSETLGHAVSLAQPLTQLPWALQINGDADAALLESERALALEEEVVHPQFFGIAHAMRGWALSRIGQDEEGIAELERALADELRASHIWAVMIGTLLAEVHMRQGRREAARELLDQTRSLTESMATCFFEPELLRVEAQWLVLAGREDQARQLLLQAIATAREHGSWAFAVRGALALAHTPSTEHEADLKLLSELCEHLPPENDTDYGRGAEALLGRLATTTTL